MVGSTILNAIQPWKMGLGSEKLDLSWSNIFKQVYSAGNALGMANVFDTFRHLQKSNVECVS